jgi:nitrate reductase assembly molybdenum cofactor insertion protein NarJ
MIAIKQQDTSGPGFVLASLIAAYPDEKFQENVAVLLKGGDLEQITSEQVRASLGAVRARLSDLLGNPQSLDDLRSEYIDSFDRGRQVNSLYETEYGRERAMVKGTQLVDIAGFYRAFGLETGGEGVQAEMIDHVAVELEFYALLALKSALLNEEADQNGIEIVLDARKKFLKTHLGRFVGAICERPGVSASPFYSAAFKYCRDLVLDECQRLGVEIEPESWLVGQTEPAEMSCGGSVGCTK